MAGVGNVFLGDDGFGTEVATALAGLELPGGAEAVDFGIRGVHLAYELLDGCDLLASMGCRPGRSVVVACEPADLNPGMGLSEPVRAAVPHAVRAVQEILAQAERLAAQGGWRHRGTWLPGGRG